jgi:4-amino-4-deoxy-L-arabinose transferase-like glycosyltransferase
MSRLRLPDGRSRVWLTLIVGAHLALGLLYDRATPIFEASDEGAHYGVIHWLANRHPLPVQEPGAPEKPWAQEGSQPPLYYLLGAGLTAWLDTSDFERVFIYNPQTRIGIPGTSHNANLYRHPLTPLPLTGAHLAVRLIRWFSLGLSCVTIWLAHRLAGRVFPDRGRWVWLATALVAFNPMAIFINASVNNDNLLMLLSTAILLVALRMMRADILRLRWTAAGLGLLLGLAALTKLSGLVLWPIAALGVGWGAWRRAGGGKREAIRLQIANCMLLLLIAFGIALFVSGWWFGRNYALYGEWLGLRTMIAVAGPRVLPITLIDLIRREWYSFFMSYWGVFGAFTILPAPWIRTFFGVLTVWALVGGVPILIRQRSRPRAEIVLLGLFCLLTFVGVVRWTLQTFASQGRLMFGAIAPLSIFMAAGLLSPFARFRSQRVFSLEPWASALVISTLLFIAALIPITDIAPRYAPPPQLAEADLPSDLRPVRAVLGEGMELIGYASDDAPRRPGEEQKVTLYWRALTPMTRDYELALQLFGRGVELVGTIDSWPGGGNAPTTQWKPGTIFADTYYLPVSEQAAVPTTLRLSLGAWDGAPENRLPVTLSDGRLAASVEFRVGRAVPARSPRFVPALVEGSTFEHGIALLGVDAGENGALTLYWKTEHPVPADYTVFLHLVDASGATITQADGPPVEGYWPASAWTPGLAFADQRKFDAPPQTPPGRYAVRLGFYDPASGARLLAFRANGTRWQDDVVVINDLIEVK